MIIGISMLKLLDAFTSLSFGIYLVEIRRGEEKTFWHVAYTDYDGIIITASEIIDAEDVFDYTIYTDSFIEDAINSHNKELESLL